MIRQLCIAISRIATTVLVACAFAARPFPARGLDAQHHDPSRPRIDVVFVLDTTGSMSELLQAAKEQIWSIASELACAKPR